MMNKRTLKKCINAICDELFAECLAASLYVNKQDEDNVEALLFSIIKLQSNAISRISHPEPGMAAKKYYKDLREKFSSQASEIIDQINNMN